MNRGEGRHTQRVDLALSPNAAQRRWTVVIRPILAIPHLVILFFLGVAALIVAVIGWFGALAVGRLPGFAAEYLGGVVQWQYRVGCYLYFLTDRYPPFELGPVPEYPVEIAVRPGALNRWAVLFRIALAVPGYVVTAVVSSGAAVVSVVSWVLTLVAGRLPKPFFEGFAAALRLEARFAAYWTMVSAEYPWWGLFGDELSGVHPPPQHPLPPPSGDYPPSAPGPDDPRWRLQVSGGAKALIVIFVVVGGLSAGFSAVVRANAVTATIARTQTVDAFDALASEVHHYDAAVVSCVTLSCARRDAGVAAGDLRGFGHRIAEIVYPSSATTEASGLEASAYAASGVFDQLAAAPSIAAFSLVAPAATGRLRAVEDDYRRVLAALNRA